MKKHFNFFRKTILLLGAGLALLTAFTSCENFLKGADVRKDLEEAIEIANTQPITYFVSVDKGSGEVTPSSVSVKKKVNFELIFKPEDDWNFICWEVIDAETGEVLPDVIKFENPQNPQTKGYVISPREKALIHPKCVHLPYVTSISPATAMPANMPITITFNIPMEEPETTPENTLFNFTNISITCNGVNINDKFDSPVFNSDKTELLIIPKSDQINGVYLYNYIQKELKVESVEVKVEFSDAIFVKSNEIEIPLQNKAFSVYYLQSIDKTAPKGSLFITRDSSITLDNALSFAQDKRFSKDFDLNNYTEASVRQNACNGTFYIYGSYDDDPIGIKSIIIKENILHNLYGVVETVNPAQVSKEYRIDIPNENVISKTENGHTYFVIKHTLTAHFNDELNAYLHREGAISVNIYVNDYCYNPSTNEQYTVIRRNPKFSSNNYAEKYPVEKPVPYEWTSYDTYMADYLQYLKARTFYANLNNIQLYKDLKYSLDNKDLSIYFEYTNSEHKVIERKADVEKGTFKLSEEQTLTHKITCDFDDLKIWPDSSIKFKIKDFLGNDTVVDSFTYNFPSDENLCIPNISKEYCDDIDSRGITVRKVTYYEGKGNIDDLYPEYFILLRQKNNQVECVAQLTSYVDGEGEIYQFESLHALSNDYTYGVIIGGILMKKSYFTIDGNEITSLPEVHIEDISLADNVVNNHNRYMTLNVKINDENNDGIPDVDYDYIICEFNGITIVPKDTINLTLKDKVWINNIWKNFYNEHFSQGVIKIWGCKNNVKSAINQKVIPCIDFNTATPEQKIAYDCEVPAKKINLIGNKIEIIVYDLTSGVDKGIFTINKKTYETAASTSEVVYTKSIAEIPFYELIPSTTDATQITYSISDNAGITNQETCSANDFLNSKKYSLKISEKKPELSPVANTLFLNETPNDNYKCYFTTFNYTNNTFPADCPEILNDNGIKIPDSGIIDSNIESEQNNTYLKVFYGEKYSVNKGSVSFNYGTCSNPLYFYKGVPGDMDNDYLLPNGSSKESVLIGSDKPVYVHTLVTSAPLTECSTWDCAEWEFFKEEYNERILNFTGNSDPQFYFIPVTKIAEGKHYIVIAHYSNNNVKMSEIFTK